MQNNKKIVITTKNVAKVEALERVCQEIFTDQFEIISIESDSEISETPINDQEAIQGCNNRIKNVMKIIDFEPDYIVSLEGLIEKTSVGTFVFGWAVIRNKENKLFYGCSGKVMLPTIIADKIKPSIKLSELIKESYSDISEERRNLLGANGVVTNGLYTRVDEFITSIKCAFGTAL